MFTVLLYYYKGKISTAWINKQYPKKIVSLHVSNLIVILNTFACKHLCSVNKVLRRLKPKHYVSLTFSHCHKTIPHTTEYFRSSTKHCIKCIKLYSLLHCIAHNICWEDKSSWKLINICVAYHPWLLTFSWPSCIIKHLFIC